MKINQLQNFISVVEYGSMNKAAEKLYTSQPNLSRSIQSLEEEMGKELLVRTNHGVSMTPTGRLLYYYAQSILNDLNVLERIKHLDEKQIYSKLSVSVAQIFIKDDLVLKCYEQLCSSETEIQIIETTTEGVLEDVTTSKSEIGVAVINTLQLPILKKMAELRNLSVECIGTGPVYIHMKEDHELAQGDEVQFSSLLNCTYVHQPNDFFSNLNKSICIDHIHITNFPKQLVMSNYHTMLHIAKRTNSFMLGHKWQKEELAHSHMNSVLLKDSPVERVFVILTHKQDLQSDAAHIFIDLIKNTYACM